MNYRLFFLLVALISAITLVLFATWRRPSRLLVLLTAFSLGASAQNPSTFVDPSRVVDWSTAGLTIPNYTANCPVQPTLSTGSGAASANATAIQNALASCDSTHNLVNIPAGTFYVAGFHYGSQGLQALRGAGANSTDLILTAEDNCAGMNHGVCMVAPNWTYSGDSSVLPPSGTRQCLWTAGYAQGTTSITLSSCGGTPPLNQTLVLDQANDSSDTGGVYVCNSSISNCTYDPSSNANGRIISGVQYSTQQVVKATAVTSLGGGSYSVTISPGVYPTNIRSGQTPGAWWPGLVQNEGIENLTLDGTALTHGTLSMFSCYQCWAKGVTFLDGARNSVLLYQSSHDVIRDSYFFGAQSSHTQSYNIEIDTSSDNLIENNIFQQVTTPMLFNGGSMGNVAGYNYTIKTIYTDGTWAWHFFASHDAADDFNLFEGNVGVGIQADNSSGPANQVTAFRNMFTGWEAGTINVTVPFIVAANSRNFNFIGNVLGQPGYHTNYQAYATSTTTFTGSENGSIYNLGAGGTGDVCALNPGMSTLCDPLTYSTSMRWGNWDVVTNGTKWSSTEAAPAANTYVNANFTSTYFNTLAHTLPNSLYYSSTPSWWPGAKAWPPIGPDVSSGNVGICTGTYAGSQATSSGQCTGGTLSTAWASHATSIPAQDCFLNVMHGPPDGTGGALGFDASKCYSSSGTAGGTVPGSPTGLTASVQ